jgi:YebC/PmpR family DNA-binding regulatory protein
MAGHSKWANIKHKKAAQDAKRGKVFTRLIREITVAAKNGGDPADNPRLRLAVDKAYAANMNKDTVERAVKRGSGADASENYDELVYEGYAPGGVAILVEVMTDNKNRTVSEVRHAFTKMGGNLGTDGSVAYLFTKRGEILFEPGTDEDQVMEQAIEAGADDVEVDEEGGLTVVTPWETLAEVDQVLKTAGLTPHSSEINQHPSTEVPVEGEAEEKLQKMIDMLEECDDVQNVFTNAVFSG